jgi:hypothetical protein
MDNSKTDQWLRSSLEDYRPVPGGDGRAKFLQEAAQINEATRLHQNNKKWWLLGLLMLVAGASSTYIIYLANEPVPAHRLAVEITVPDQTPVIPVQKIETVSPELASTILTAPSVTNETSIVKNEKLASYSGSASSEINYREVTPPHPVKVDVMKDVPVVAVATDEIQINDGIIDNLLLEKGEILPETDTLQKSRESSVEFAPEDTPMILKSDARQKHLAYSLFYRPEITYNLIESNMVSHHFGLEVQYRFFNDRYSIRTGAGLSVSKGYYEYATEYQEFLGSYQKLDSITFAWDERRYHLLPTYFKSEEEVFNDTLTTEYAKVMKQHFYLQVPMILGYDFIKGKNLRFGLRAGPRLSLLMETKTLSHLVDQGKNKVIQINQITPDRIRANWQFVAALNLGLYSKGRLFYELEPQFTYYFNSVYESPDQQKRPWSLGLRLAVGFK